MMMEYNVRTDLAIQKKNLKLLKIEAFKNLKVKEYSEKNWWYTNILFKSLELKEVREEITQSLANILKRYYQKYNLNINSTILIVGLGNENVVSDSLGPKTLDGIIATAHFFNVGLLKKGLKIYKFKPGVMDDTGMSAFLSTNSLIKALKPDLIITIDSLVSSKISYINKLIQVTDRGIMPGSGVNNHQTELSFDTLGIPVIVIGVAMATTGAAIIRDALNVRKNKLEFKKGYDFVVSYKDVDVFALKISRIISESINTSFNIWQ